MIYQPGKEGVKKTLQQVLMILGCLLIGWIILAACEAAGTLQIVAR
jgi:hypothetical protein